MPRRGCVLEKKFPNTKDTKDSKEKKEPPLCSLVAFVFNCFSDSRISPHESRFSNNGIKSKREGRKALPFSCSRAVGAYLLIVGGSHLAKLAMCAESEP